MFLQTPDKMWVEAGIVLLMRTGDDPVARVINLPEMEAGKRDSSMKIV